jgi:hypothetical protein
MDVCKTRHSLRTLVWIFTWLSTARSEFESQKSVVLTLTGSEAHPASCTMGTGGPIPGGKARSGRDADHSPPSSAEVLNE